MGAGRTIRFILGGMRFEYDEQKNRINISKHGISFRSAARVFFDYDRIELFDEENSCDEDRYDTIGDTSAGNLLYGHSTVIGNVQPLLEKINDILFVVYTERKYEEEEGKSVDIIRIISARMATDFERGSIMVNMNDLSRMQMTELAFTEEELRELENARKMPISFDEDCPETTPERVMQFKRVNPKQNRMTSNPA